MRAYIIFSQLLALVASFHIAPSAIKNRHTTSFRSNLPKVSSLIKGRFESSFRLNCVWQATATQSSDPVKKIIGSNFASATVGDSVASAVQTMSSINTGGSLVFDTDGELAGIFTERDYLTKIVEGGQSAMNTKIEDVMTSADKLINAKDSDSINSCRQIMANYRVRHLPIVDANGKAVGLVSMRDIINVLNEDQILNSKYFGQNMADVEEQARSLANLNALEGGEERKKQDVARTGFVIAAAVIGAALLQGEWVRDHSWATMSLTFLLGYVGIVFENLFEFNKAAIALLMCVALWVIYAGTSGATGVPVDSAVAALGEKVSEVSEVVFFLMGAMTIVEIVDSHQGFKVVTDKISANNKRGLMWVIGIITFFMSAILDNLTTTIVMVSLIKKLLPDQEDRKLFGAMIVIAANAGGAWTPIGDVTTTMLWINGQISALPTMTNLLLPSIASVGLSIGVLQGQIPADAPVPPRPTAAATELAPRGSLVFATGILGLLSVPLFKALTGLPPYLGMLAALGVMWTLTDAIHAGEEGRENLLATSALRKIDTSGVLFFLGILLSVGAMDSAGILRSVAEFLNENIPSESIVAAAIGLVSAVIDNVPLVAATMGMYPTSEVPMDASLWQLIAFCAGTGGSLLVIGSAAGVALMGLEKVDFGWYAKKISLGALVGYVGGIGVYLAQQKVVELVAGTPALAELSHTLTTALTTAPQMF